MLDKIVKINQQVNRSIKYKRGLNGWQLDYLPDGGEGDCDTYAYTKYRMLKDRGVPDKDMRFIPVKTSFGEDHLILRVSFGGKQYYLDNRYDTVWDTAPDNQINDGWIPYVVENIIKKNYVK